MLPVHSGDNDFIFILDNDETIDSNNKQSTVKMFQLGSQLTFKGEWDSLSFGTIDKFPINDIYFYKFWFFVTIGNYGLGYG